MINKILFLCVAFSFCLHASTAETPQIGWKENLVNDLDCQVKGAGNVFLQKYGIENLFNMMSLHLNDITQDKIANRDYQLTVSKTPLIDPTISDNLIDLIKTRFTNFDLDVNSLQVVRLPDDDIRYASMACDYCLDVNQYKLLQLTQDQQRHTIDHEIFHWKCQHALLGLTVVRMCLGDFDSKFKKDKDHIRWARWQERQADILAGLADIRSARATQARYHNYLASSLKEKGATDTDCDDIFLEKEQLYNSLDPHEQMGIEQEAVKIGNRMLIWNYGDEQPPNFVCWHYMKQLTEMMKANEKEGSSND